MKNSAEPNRAGMIRWKLPSLSLPSFSFRRRAEEKPAAVAVMKPYLSDPQSPSRRRARRWLVGGVVLFCLFYGLVYAFVTPFLLPVLASPVAILLLIVIWALPDHKDPPIAAMEAFFFATIASMVLWPNYLAIALPGLPWITVARLTMFPFAFLLLVCASTSTPFRTQLFAALNATPLLWRLLMAFVVVQFFSIFVSSEKGQSTQKFLIDQIDWTIVFFAGAYLFLKPGRADRFAKLLWGMSIPIGIIALWEYKVRHVLWIGHIPSFLQINDENMKSILGASARAYTNEYRSHATFTTPLGMAEFLAMTTPFIIHYVITPVRMPLRIAAGISTPFLLIAIIISGSRLGVIGFGLSVIIYGLVWSVMRWRRNPGDLIGAAVVFAYPLFFAGVVAASFLVGKIHKAVWGGGAQAVSTQARIVQYQTGIPKVLSHPWGYGAGRGAETLGFFDPSGKLTIDAYYLLIALDYGIIGFIVYYAMIAIAIYYAFRWSMILFRNDDEVSLLVPLGISLTSFLVSKAVFSNTDNHTLMFIMLGGVAALVYRARQAAARPAAGSAPGQQIVRSTGV